MKLEICELCFRSEKPCTCKEIATIFTEKSLQQNINIYICKLYKKVNECKEKYDLELNRKNPVKYIVINENRFTLEEVIEELEEILNRV